MATYTKGTFSYPPEVVKAVLDGYGVRTASQLAAEYGLKSRHVVVGIWSRARTHGLQMKAPDKPRSPKPERLKLPARLPATPRRIIPEPDPMLQIPASDTKDPRGVHQARLKGHHCRWPMWGHFERPTVFFYCGQPRHEQRSYCLHHCKVAYPNMKDPS